MTDGIAALTQMEAPVRSIADGDAFAIRAGCDKCMETCGAKFANTANFRGFPHIPGQDAVLRYATKGGHEGGRCRDRPIPLCAGSSNGRRDRLERVAVFEIQDPRIA